MMNRKIINQRISTYTIVIFILIIEVGYSQRKPMDISQEVLFYSRLFDEYKKIDRLTTITNEVTSNAKLIRNIVNDGVYDALNEKASKEAGVASGIIDDLYNQFEKFVDDYELPDFEDIPEANNIINLDGLSANGQREIINSFLTELTNDAVYYNGKISDYDATTLYLKGIENAAIKVKMENHHIAKAIIKYMKKGVPIPWQTAWKFHQIYAKQLTRIRNKIKSKRKNWEEKVKNQRIRFNNYKANIATLLNLERQSLQEEYDNIKEQVKEYQQNLKELKLEIKRIKSYGQELQELEQSINSESLRLENLERTSKNYSSTIGKLSRRLTRIKNWTSYKLKYNGCKNGYAYDECTHNPDKTKFRNKRKKTIKKLEGDISYNQSQKGKTDSQIVKIHNNIEAKKARVAFLKEELLKLPIKESELEVLEREIEDFFKRVDVFFTLRLLNENQRNINKILAL
ncbi:hypothetical protein [Maribacter litoralis]|uniref:hypothetical protein n=1 Tax=Maribacter litoralis TaxID=2059726 RepID=UPI000E31C63C|nr:hypothetical protein [Maribacter litoralis]